MYTFETKTIKDNLQLYNFPKSIVIETSAYCNLKCPMCPQPFMTRPKGYMDIKIFEKIVNEVSRIAAETPLWLALLGEPLMNPARLIEMVKISKSLGLSNITLNTNGLLLTKEISKNLITEKLDKILISIDAVKNSTYEKLRKGGDLYKLIDNINVLLGLKKELNSPIKVITQFIIMEENELEVDTFKTFWIGKGTIVKIRPKLSWGNTIEAKNLALTYKDRTYPCPWLARTASIHWSGKFTQCDFDFEGNYSPGDITKQTIEEVWNGEILYRREKHWRGDFSHPLCKECKDWQVGRSLFFEEAL